MTDFILSNTDRHLNNIGFLMDDSLKIRNMAPIFDTRKSMFVDQRYYHDTEELLSIKVNSFASKEIKLLKLVQNKNVVDLTKTPPVSQIEKLYQKDEKIPDTFLKKVCNAYEKKIDLCRDFQLGKDLHKIKVAFQDRKYER